MFFKGLDKFARRHLDAAVKHAVAVVGQDDVHEVFANVMDVALDGSEQNTAARTRLIRFHVRLKVRDCCLHDLCRFQHFRDDQLIRRKEPPHLIHASHEWAIDNLKRTPFPERDIKIRRHPLAHALHDTQRDTLIERQPFHAIHALFGGCGAPFPVMRRERGNRVIAPPVDQVIGQRPLLLGKRRVAHQPPCVDDGAVQARLYAVVEHDGIQRLTSRLRQPERHVGDAKRRLGERKRLIDELDALDSLHGGADIVLVARADGKRQGIEDDVLAAQSVLLRQQGI